MNLSTGNHPWRIVALYRFFPVADPLALRDRLLPLCREAGIRGTLIVAGEGLNGTLAGTQTAVGTLLAELDRLEGFGGAELKFSSAADMPFRRLKIRVKHEIVTMGVDDVDPVAGRGAYVEPADWNALIADPDTIVIDTRNAYETAIGTFEGAVDPETRSFREFPDWIGRNHNRLRNRRIAMFCTGGIRCEKATAYVKSLGFPDVFHLRGGILKYLETVPEDESLWRGECFVFDERVSVTHGLAEGETALCRACRHPLTAAEIASPDYVEGVSCPHCRSTRSDADRRRYADRQRQVTRALERGEPVPIGLARPRRGRA
ncbi:MAG: rhodanese-related sulfurtransferase [Rhizobiaceae bacterium]